MLHVACVGAQQLFRTTLQQVPARWIFDGYTQKVQNGISCQYLSSRANDGRSFAKTFPGPLAPPIFLWSKPVLPSRNGDMKCSDSFEFGHSWPFWLSSRLSPLMPLSQLVPGATRATHVRTADIAPIVRSRVGSVAFANDLVFRSPRPGHKPKCVPSTSESAQSRSGQSIYSEIIPDH